MEQLAVPLQGAFGEQTNCGCGDEHEDKTNPERSHSKRQHQEIAPCKADDVESRQLPTVTKIFSTNPSIKANTRYQKKTTRILIGVRTSCFVLNFRFSHLFSGKRIQMHNELLRKTPFSTLVRTRQNSSCFLSDKNFELKVC